MLAATTECRPATRAAVNWGAILWAPSLSSVLGDLACHLSEHNYLIYFGYALPEVKSHRRTVLSLLLVASSRPSGLNATLLALSVWPVFVRPVTTTEFEVLTAPHHQNHRPCQEPS